MIILSLNNIKSNYFTLILGIIMIINYNHFPECTNLVCSRYDPWVIERKKCADILLIQKYDRIFHALLLILILFTSDCFTHKRTKRNGRII